MSPEHCSCGGLHKSIIYTQPVEQNQVLGTERCCVRCNTKQVWEVPVLSTKLRVLLTPRSAPCYMAQTHSRT